MKLVRLLPAMAAVAAFALLHPAATQAQGFAGRWQGNVNSQNGVQQATLTLDSTTTGWSGSILVPAMGSDAMLFATVTVHADTVSMSMPLQNVTVTLQGKVGADTKTLAGQIWIDGNDGGTFSFTRAAAPAAPAPPAAPVKPPHHLRG